MRGAVATVKFDLTAPSDEAQLIAPEVASKKRQMAAGGQPSGQVKPRSFGLIFEPPQITLVYQKDGKYRKRTMPVRHLTADSNPKAVAEAIIQAHPQLLGPQLVSHGQVERLVKKLVEHRAGTAAAAAEKPPPPPPTASAPPPSAGGGSSSNGSSSAPVVAAPPPVVDIADADGDLNKVSEDQLKAAKDAMDAGFQQHALRPGDAGYVHDKRVAPPEELEDNDWDDEMDSVELVDEPSLKDMLRELEENEG